MPFDDYKIIDSAALAQRLGVPESWIRNQTRRNCPDPIPHVKVGRYVRFEWPSKRLYLWWSRHRRADHQEPPSPERQPAEAPRLMARKILRRRRAALRSPDQSERFSNQAQHSAAFQFFHGRSESI